MMARARLEICYAYHSAILRVFTEVEEVSDPRGKPPLGVTARAFSRISSPALRFWLFERRLEKKYKHKCHKMRKKHQIWGYVETIWHARVASIRSFDFFGRNAFLYVPVNFITESNSLVCFCRSSTCHQTKVERTECIKLPPGAVLDSGDQECVYLGITIFIEFRLFRLQRHKDSLWY